MMTMGPSNHTTTTGAAGVQCRAACCPAACCLQSIDLQLQDAEVTQDSESIAGPGPASSLPRFMEMNQSVRNDAPLDPAYLPFSPSRTVLHITLH